MYDVTMPKLSDSMEVGKIIQWRAREGDEVHEGDVLAEIESDKAVMELECFHDGTVAKIVHGDDSEVKVGEVIAYIAAKGEKIEAVKAEAAAAKAVETTREAKEEPKEKAAPAAARRRPKAGRIAISPYARKLAEQKGVDYTQLKGTGVGGRVVARDIEAAAAGRPAVEKRAAPKASEKKEAPAGEPSKEIAVEPLARTLAEKHGIDISGLSGTGVQGRITVDDVLAASKVLTGAPQPPPDEELPAVEVREEEGEVEEAPFRLRTQAMRVTASKHVIPHFYMTQSVDVTQLLERKDELKQKLGATVTHLVMLASLKAVEQHPEINRSYDRGRIIRWKGVNLGLAVATDVGLTVAVLRGAHGLSLKEIVQRTSALVERARAGKLSAEERRHPTFTITNLGMFGVEYFEPIINPPSAVTLGVPAALPTPVVRDGQIQVGKVMRLTLSCDHRIIDGVAAAGFLKDLKGLLEDPERLLSGT